MDGYTHTLRGAYYILRRIVAARFSQAQIFSSLLWEVSLQ